MQRKTLWIPLLSLLVLGALIALVYILIQRPDDTPTDINTNPTPAVETEPSTKEYKSAKGVTIEIDDWTENREVSSPLVITGRVPGSWSFEGQFPIELVYEGDIGLPGTTATLNGDWMTDALVPFTATLTFDEANLTGGDVVIMLRNANPSGMPENDDSLALKVRVSQ